MKFYSELQLVSAVFLLDFGKTYIQRFQVFCMAPIAGDRIEFFFAVIACKKIATFPAKSVGRAALRTMKDECPSVPDKCLFADDRFIYHSFATLQVPILLIS
jgi:hypothetical protein